MNRFTFLIPVLTLLSQLITYAESTPLTCNMTNTLSYHREVNSFVVDIRIVDHRIRSVISERVLNGNTLLLVIERDESQSKRLPQVLLRKSFGPREKAQLQQTRRAFLDPHQKIKRTSALVKTPNPLWPIENSWTFETEQVYARWISENAKTDFLVGSGLEVDCADFAMALRWIFAREQHLPMAAHLAGTKEIIGSWESTTAWDALPTDPDWRKDARFKAGLRYILAMTYTQSLIEDLYPVEINPTYVLPGTIFLTLWSESGHTRTITKIGPDQECGGNNCIVNIWGNVPASEYGYVSDLVPYRVEENAGGFLRFRWTELVDSAWQFRSPDQMPGYSREQFLWSSEEYQNNISARLGLWNSPQERFQVLGRAAYSGVLSRVQVTQRGYFLCSLVPCDPSDSIYTDWSTPVRDNALSNSIQNFIEAGRALGPDDPSVVDFKNQYNIPIFRGLNFTYDDVLFQPLSSNYSSDPRVDIFTRWGLGVLTTRERLHMLLSAIEENWAWREQLVYAQKATERLDQAFRQMQTQFLSEFRQADESDRTELIDIMRSNQTSVYGCNCDYCTLFDFVVARPELWQRMSSRADDPENKRFGSPEEPGSIP